jgi:aspartate aminotransferase
LVFEPYYSNYATCAAFSDVTLKAIPTSAANGFHLPNKKNIASAISPKTKAILICSPNNPTGTIYSKDELAMIVSIAKEHNLYLLSDEVYREFSYDTSHTSILSFAAEIPEQLILLDSLSKRYSLCGARIGILHTQNEKLFNGIIKLAQGRLSGGLIDQIMAANMTAVPPEWTASVKKEYQKRRDLIYSDLSKIPGVKLTKPEGAFYTMVTLPVDNAEAFCIFLLQKFRINNETVMMAPGAGFYQSPGLGVNQVRLAYVLNETDLTRAITIIKEGLTAYSGT